MEILGTYDHQPSGAERRIVRLPTTDGYLVLDQPVDGPDDGPGLLLAVQDNGDELDGLQAARALTADYLQRAADRPHSGLIADPKDLAAAFTLQPPPPDEPVRPCAPARQPPGRERPGAATASPPSPASERARALAP
jgi:hypothetical protein